MATVISATELRNLSAEDLRKEITRHRAQAAKVRLDIELKKEKNTAKLRSERKAIARLHTVLAEKTRAESTATPAKEELKTAPKTSKVRAPKKTS